MWNLHLAHPGADVIVKAKKEYQELGVHEKGRARAVRVTVHPKIIMAGHVCSKRTVS